MISDKWQRDVANCLGGSVCTTVLNMFGGSALPTPPPHAETITTYGCTTLESRLEAERRKERTRELQQAKEEGFAARALRSAASWLW